MLKKNPIALAEADLAQLEKRRIGLDARRTAAAAAALAATSARRALLVDNDDPSAADLGKADRTCRDAADAEAAAADALAELDSRIAGVKDRLTRLQEAADRERQAAALDAIAAKADDAAKRITKAAREIAAARADLAAAITPEVAGLYAPPHRDSYGTPTALVTTSYGPQGRALESAISPEAVASRFAGHILAPALPTLGLADEAEAHTWHQPRAVTHTLVGTDTVDAVAALLSVPLRARAEALRNGEVLADPMPYVPAPEDLGTSALSGISAERVPPGFSREDVAPGVMKLWPVGGAAA